MNFLRLSEHVITSATGSLTFKHEEMGEYGTAYEISEKASLTFSIPRSLGATEAEIVISNDTSEVYKTIAQYIDFSGFYDVYSVTLPLKTFGVGLFFGKIKLKTLFGNVYAYKACDELRFSKDEGASGFQLTVSDFAYEAPKDKYGGVIYQIFVDRFARGDSYKTRDGMIYVEDWNSEIPEFPEYPGAHLKNNYFYGGTLDGIAEKLPITPALRAGSPAGISPATIPAGILMSIFPKFWNTV